MRARRLRATLKVDQRPRFLEARPNRWARVVDGEYLAVLVRVSAQREQRSHSLQIDGRRAGQIESNPTDPVVDQEVRNRRAKQPRAPFPRQVTRDRDGDSFAQLVPYGQPHPRFARLVRGGSHPGNLLAPPSSHACSPLRCVTLLPQLPFHRLVPERQGTETPSVMGSFGLVTGRDRRI